MDAEEKPQVDGAAEKVANKMAGDDRPAIDLVERNRLARIGVSSRRACLPGRDGRAAAMGLAFVLHDSVLGKTARNRFAIRSEEHTSELQSLMRISYAVFCLKKKKNTNKQTVQ